MISSRTRATAQTLPPPETAPRVVLFGLRCRFTDGVVNELERQGIVPVAILLPGPPGLMFPHRERVPGRPLPMATQQQSRPTRGRPDRYQIGGPGAAGTLELVHSFAPDVIAVACYPRRLPLHLYQIARLGAVNVHPSLLPAHRGPDPLFWTLREGTGEAGVSIHGLVEEFDAGPILAQEPVSYEDGTMESVLETRLATIGGRLLAQSIERMQEGSIETVVQLSEGASYESWPTVDDYVIDTRRTARSAFNFLRGVSERGVPLGIRCGDTTIGVRNASSWSDREACVEPGHVAIPFAEGFLQVEPESR